MASYKITSCKQWLDEHKQPVLAYGGLAHSLTLEGDLPEEHSPYLFDAFTQKPLEVGQVVNGRVEFYETSKGTTRQRLVINRPLVLNDRQALITAQWAVRLGYEHAQDHTNKEEVSAIADMAMLIARELAEAYRD